MKDNFWQKSVAGIAYKELVWVLLLYAGFSILYYLTLRVNGMEYTGERFWASISLNSFKPQALDYLLKFLLTCPIWWLIFRWMRHLKLYLRLMVHLVTLPAFALLWQQLYYYAATMLGYSHLRGPGQIWDVYIPVLFYAVQFGLFHAYEYYRDNQEQQKKEAELREAALKSELSALKAQINPHFLYNVFNTINALIPQEQEKTRVLIAELSDLFRYQLRASRADTVPLWEELDFVKKYLNLEKERFQERLEVYIEVDEALLERPVPPMILQPLVENCIKHGLASLIEGGMVAIRILDTDGLLYFEIADTGVGVADKSRLFHQEGIGLSNTKTRLEKIYGTDMRIEDNRPRGLKVSFSIA